MTLYIECNMGAAGDMLTAALYELLPAPQAFLDKINSLGLPGVEVVAEPSVKCGITGTHISVRVRGDSLDEVHEHIGTLHSHENHAHERNFLPAHSHGRSYSYDEIVGIIKSLDIGDKPKHDALAVYELIARAEASVHGGSFDSVHFHEVGALDAIADIVGVCVLVDMLGVSDIYSSPVHVGSGTVRCAHGIVPVPAPATALLLKDIPIYGGDVRGELCTPTGAALLRHFCSRFGAMEPMAVSKIGYGMGKKDFERANCVRAFLGERADGTSDEIAELCCNLDDMTAEAIGFATEELLNSGALDVFVTPVYMKKNRPAHVLTVLCKAEDSQRFTELVFRYTTTLGVRSAIKNRAILRRRSETRDTKYGAVRVKIAEGYGVRREKAEYDDIARLAREHGVGLDDIL